MVRFHIIIRGHVQGVGFRYFVQKTASMYGIKGWVRNKQYDSVEIDAEGSETNMEHFIEAVKKGNHFSSIDSFEINEINTMADYRSFRIMG